MYEVETNANGRPFHNWTPFFLDCQRLHTFLLVVNDNLVKYPAIFRMLMAGHFTTGPQFFSILDCQVQHTFLFVVNYNLVKWPAIGLPKMDGHFFQKTGLSKPLKTVCFFCSKWLAIGFTKRAGHFFSRNDSDI